MLPLPTRPRSIIDRLVDHGRILAADLPPSFVSKFAATVSKIAAAYPSSTFGAAATSVIDHISSVPTLSELGRHAMNGQLSAVVRAEVRRLSYMASRRHLGHGSIDLNLEEILTSIQGGDLTSEINCPNAGKALVKTILSSTGLLTVADSDASIDEFVDTAYGCFCSLDLSGPEGQKIQTVLNTGIGARPARPLPPLASASIFGPDPLRHPSLRPSLPSPQTCSPARTRRRPMSCTPK